MGFVDIKYHTVTPKHDIIVDIKYHTVTPKHDIIVDIKYHTVTPKHGIIVDIKYTVTPKQVITLGGSHSSVLSAKGCPKIRLYRLMPKVALAVET